MGSQNGIIHVYRAFSERKSFEDFLCGHVTLNDICSYRNIADAARRDVSEGTLEYSEEAEKKERKVLIDRCKEARPAFILSACAGREAAAKFGDYLVRIHIKTFEEKLGTELQEQYGGHRWKVFSRTIKYDKGELNTDPISADEIAELSLFQKSCEYSHEQEYRFVAELLSEEVGREYYFDRISVRLKNPGECIERLRG